MGSRAAASQRTSDNAVDCGLSGPVHAPFELGTFGDLDHWRRDVTVDGRRRAELDPLCPAEITLDTSEHQNALSLNGGYGVGFLTDDESTLGFELSLDASKDGQVLAGFESALS